MTTMRERPHVLVVDDEKDLCELLSLRLRHEGFDATVSSTSLEALQALEAGGIDAMLLDLRLEEEDGLELLTEVLCRSADLPIIVLTAHGTTETAVDAMKRGAYGFLTKPFDDHDLVLELRHAVDHGNLKREVAGLRRMVGGSVSQRLLGTSAQIAETRERIARAASTEATVLLLGESGTGKELAARNIHDLSPRHKGPFVAINCGALPGELLESELFGHVRGAFTGAVREKEGLFAAARGGTLFLDEIGDAPPDVQVKLLRVLQERVYTPVGATDSRGSDARIIAATNRDLAQSVESGTFREDLYYRLHVVPVRMPALRERREDITLLAGVFLERASRQHRLSKTAFTEDALTFLLGHSWPGNVRELANVVEAAAVMSRDGAITLNHLQAVLPQPPRKESNGHALSGALTLAKTADSFPSLRDAKRSFEKEYLETVLRLCNGNVSAAARIAGRNRSDLHELLRRHALSAAAFRQPQDG